MKPAQPSFIKHLMKKNPMLIVGMVIGITALIGLFSLAAKKPSLRPSSSGELSSFSPQQNAEGKTAVPSQTGEGKLANFALQDYSGKTVDLSDFAGKPVVINSWASWCPFCRQELPDFATAQKEFGDRVVIIAINRSESLSIAKGYTDQQGITGDLIFLLDPSDSFYSSIGGFSMPETIFVDKNGGIVDHKRGPMDINEIRQRIQKLISL